MAERRGEEEAGSRAYEDAPSTPLAAAGRQDVPMPARGTEAYVQWVVQDAIATGLEEGYPIRDVKALEERIRREEARVDRLARMHQVTQDAAQRMPSSDVPEVSEGYRY